MVSGAVDLQKWQINVPKKTMNKSVCIKTEIRPQNTGENNVFLA